MTTPAPADHRLAGLRPASVAIAAGRPSPEPGSPLNTPIFPASSFRAGGRIHYAREGQPTWESFEEVIGVLEGGTAIAFASGMGAIAACLDLLPVGAVVVAPTHAYSGTLARVAELERRGALTVRRAAVDDEAAVAAALPGATAIWLESPTNPMLEVCDIAAASRAARAVGAMVFCDNTFATPIGQNPLELGADVVVHSATKSIGGHSDLLLGVAIAADTTVAGRLREARTLMGATPGALEAFLALRGVRTLPLRMRQAQDSALELAARLTAHPDVTRVRYPGLPDDPGHPVAVRQMSGFGSIIAIEPTGNAERAERLCAATELWTHATSLGGVDSTLERRARWATEQPDVPKNLVRLSVGCEDVDDLWTDLSRALAVSR